MTWPAQHVQKSFSPSSSSPPHAEPETVRFERRASSNANNLSQQLQNLAAKKSRSIVCSFFSNDESFTLTFSKVKRKKEKFFILVHERNVRIRSK